MWASFCNFLCRKIFSRPSIKAPPRDDSICDNDCIYGKRIKLSEKYCNSRRSCKQSSMQKENVDNSDDEDCCVIAEIPKRKVPGSSLSHSAPAINNNLKSNNVSLAITLAKKNESPNDNDIQITKSITNNSDKDKSLVQLKKKKFFNSQRLIKPNKPVKHRTSFKRQLKRRLNFLQEGYRLAEKFQYMQLLQSHTSNIADFITRKPIMGRITYKPKVIAVVDLTDEKCGDDIKNNTTIEPKNTPDKDIEIVGEVAGVKSFQDILKIRPINSKEAVRKVLSRHALKNLELLDLCGTEDNAISLLDDDDDDDGKTGPEDLEEKLRTFMQITAPECQEVEKQIDKNYSLPKLTNEQEARIKAVLVPHPTNEVLVEGFGLKITRRDMQTLKGLNWLNDEVINFYLNLIMDRSKHNKNLPNVYAFNTFFYPKLATSEYISLKRWTKKVDIFAYDLVLVPIHLGMHWCMSVIDFRNKSVRYYDSVGSPNNVCLERLLLYLKAESLDKKKKLISTGDWEKLNVEDIPQQMNGSDCGVFSCMFAEHLARGCALLFTQDNMPYFRKKMIIEILEKKLLT